MAMLTEKQQEVLQLIRREFQIEIRNNESIPAFGAALIPDDPEQDCPLIFLNVGACLLCSIEEKDVGFKEVVIETLMHEFGHVLESWMGLEASEERIENLVTLYRENYDDPASSEVHDGTE